MRSTRLDQVITIAGACLTTAFLTACTGGGASSSTVPPTNINSGSPLSAATRDVLRLRPGASSVTPHALVKRAAKSGPNVYVADAGNNAVYEILWAGGYTQMLTLGSGFNSPTGVTVDSSGDVFVADNGNQSIKEMMAVNGGIPKNPVIKTLTTSIPNPYNVALDSAKDVFVTNNSGSAVEELVAPGYTTINSYGSFTFPTSVATDGSNNVYVGTAASTSEVFEMLAPDYTSVNALGGGYNEFLNPYGLAVDHSGNVYVADYNNSAVKRMSPNCFSNGCVTTLTTAFFRPVGVAVDKSGNVYGGDAATGEVFEILKAGKYRHINQLGAGFSLPWQIAVH